MQRPFEDDSNPIKQILQADDPPNLFVDGWGHKTGREKGQAPNYIVRTMNYSKLDDEGKPVAVFVRSSELEVSKPEEQEEEFENFYD